MIDKNTKIYYIIIFKILRKIKNVNLSIAFSFLIKF